MIKTDLMAGFCAKSAFNSLPFRLSQAGLTLLEMMMVMSIAGIIAMLIIPSAQDIFTQHRIISELNRTSRLLQYARLQAITTQQNITVCPSADYIQCVDNWTLGKIVFADVNDNAQIDGDEILLISTEQSELQTQVSGPKTGVTFYLNGIGASPATIQLCDTSTQAQFSRALFVSLQGRITTSKDTNGDNVHEKNNGNALRC
ncbi:MAG: Uncharacterised protein [Glaciecola sp. HTCC2999]|jgi:type IV fimbrial biogenesis protein FimT|nr:MAG: Uncharacterised protein [Glaciecola sp. HTCC2999]